MKPGALWFEAAARDGIGEDSFSPEQQVVLELLLRQDPEIYLGQPGLRRDDSAIQVLSRQICGNTSLATRKQRLEFLNRGIAAGNRTLNWDVPLSVVPVAIHRERNQMRPDLFHDRARVKPLIEALSHSLEQTLPAPAAYGQVLCSAILFGGLLESRWQPPFLEALSRRRFYQEKSLLWMDLELKKPIRLSEPAETEGPAGLIQRKRWIADCLTQLLIYRLLDQNLVPRSKSPEPWAAVRSYLDTLPLSNECRPGSMAQLRSWGYARALLLLPPNLLAYASGSLPSASLPIGAWLRTLTGLAVPVAAPFSASVEKPVRAPRINDNALAAEANQGPLLGQLLKALNPRSLSGKVTGRKARERLLEFITQNRDHCGPMLQLLCYWGLQLLSARSSDLERRKAPALAPQSVYRYLEEIGAALVAAAGLANPLHLEPQDLEVLYEHAAARRHRSPYATFRLAQFHSFLKAFYLRELPELDWGGLCQGRTGLAEPNANLVSPQVFGLLLKALGWGRASLDRWQRLRLLAAILIYRCGLRPSELRALRLIDVQGGLEDCEILVRNNFFNSVKSNAGIRRIPIALLLTQQEMEFLLDFRTKRYQEREVFGSGLLFAHPQFKAGLLPDADLYDPIRMLLREITEDESLLLYHLRHSFLSLTAVSLSLRHEQPEDLDLAALRHGDFAPQRIAGLNTGLMENEAHGRKSQYLLALLAGHASPATSHQHYLHLQDWLLGHHLRCCANSIRLSHQAICALTGLKRARAFAILADKESLHIAVAVKSRGYTDALRHPLMAQARPLGIINPEKTSGGFPPWEIALERYLRETPEEKKIPKNVHEWEMARQIYGTVAAMEGNRRKKVMKILAYATDNYSVRWGGITYDRHASAREMMDLLDQCGLATDQIRLTHHPRRGQDDRTARVYAEKWMQGLGFSGRDYQQGEPANKNAAMARGQVTMKVITKETDGTCKSKFQFSSGLRLASKLLKFTQQNNKN